MKKIDRRQGIAISMIIVFILLAASIIIINVNKNKISVTLNQDIQLDYGNEYAPEELVDKFVDVANSDIPKTYTIEVKDVDTKKNLATQIAKVDVINDKGVVKKTYDTFYVLVDNEAPSFTGTFKYVVTEGSELTLDITVTDNRDQYIEYKLERNINTDEAGTYKVTAIATDSSGNEVKQDIEVVVEPKKLVAAEPPQSPKNPSGNKGTSATNNKPSSGTSGSTQKPTAPTAPKRTYWLLNGEKFHSYCEDWGTQHNCMRFDDSPLADNMEFLFGKYGVGPSICKQTPGCKLVTGTVEETDAILKKAVMIFE